MKKIPSNVMLAMAKNHAKINQKKSSNKTVKIEANFFYVCLHKNRGVVRKFLRRRHPKAFKLLFLELRLRK